MIFKNETVNAFNLNISANCLWRYDLFCNIEKRGPNPRDQKHHDRIRDIVPKHKKNIHIYMRISYRNPKSSFWLSLFQQKLQFSKCIHLQRFLWISTIQKLAKIEAVDLFSLHTMLKKSKISYRNRCPPLCTQSRCARYLLGCLFW